MVYSNRPWPKHVRSKNNTHSCSVRHLIVLRNKLRVHLPLLRITHRFRTLDSRAVTGENTHLEHVINFHFIITVVAFCCVRYSCGFCVVWPSHTGHRTRVLIYGVGPSSRLPMRPWLLLLRGSSTPVCHADAFIFRLGGVSGRCVWRPLNHVTHFVATLTGWDGGN